MSKSKKSTIKTICFMIVFAVIVIVIYWYVSTRTTPLFSKPDGPTTEIEKLLNKDIPGNYPSTPREVIKLYCRITKVLYSEELEDEQIEKLSEQLSSLYDDELIANKTKEEYLLDLKVDISSYRKSKRNIMQYVIENSDRVVYWDKEDRNYASLVASFTTKESNTYTKIFEEFILRKDSAGKWKILGWKLSDKTEIIGGE
mgnify:CR=1 FL=1